MAVHTGAAVDYANLIAGRATPVLTTHLWLSVVLYPVFGVTLIGLAVLLEVEWARLLFPLLLLLALWLALAALWPVRVTARSTVEEAAASA